MNLFGYTYKIYDIGYKTEMMSKECNSGDPLETPGGLYRGPPSNENTIFKKTCMPNIYNNNRRYPRYETPTKSASRKLHEKCCSYRNIAPKSAAPLLLPSLYISRSVSSANFAKKCVHSQHRSSEVGFLTFFRNGTNQSATRTTQMSHVFRIYSRMARRNTNTLPAVDAEYSPTLST